MWKVSTLFLLLIFDTYDCETIVNITFLNVGATKQLSLFDSKKSDDITIYLSTRQNKDSPQAIRPHQTLDISNSYFNANNPTRIIIHGWRDNGYSKINYLIRNAYLSRGDYNIFVIDWGSVAKSINYYKSKNFVDTVGKTVAGLIDDLNEHHGMHFDTLYIIGHSLGAHAAGIAGKNVKRGRINTIFGLDPASPLFYVKTPNGRLSNTDAEYVEVIHTNGEKLGFFNPIGITNFYPNGGKIQPGCNEDVIGKCSHGRSYEYFAESIQYRNKFSSKSCNNFDELQKQTCNKNPIDVKMGGEPSNHGKNIAGIFYLATNSKSPYAID